MCRAERSPTPDTCRRPLAVRWYYLRIARADERIFNGVMTSWMRQRHFELPRFAFGRCGPHGP
jgi:hypothetical protein